MTSDSKDEKIHLRDEGRGTMKRAEEEGRGKREVLDKIHLAEERFRTRYFL